MSDRKRQIDEAVGKVLDSLNDIEDVRAGSGFFAGLYQKVTRLDDKKTDWLGNLSAKIRLQPLLFCLLVAFNLFSAVVIILNHEKKEMVRREQSESIADEYAAGIGGYGGYYPNK